MGDFKIIKCLNSRNIIDFFNPRVRFNIIFNFSNLPFGLTNFKIHAHVHGILDGIDGIASKHKQQKQGRKNYQSYGHDHSRGQRQPDVAAEISETCFDYSKER